MTARPHLPHYFPNYDIYVWLDSDTWVATPTAINTLVSAVNGKRIAVIPSVDRCYSRYYGLDALKNILEKVLPMYRNHLPEGLAHTMLVIGEMCSGVFAIPVNSPIWNEWAEEIGKILTYSAGLSVPLSHIFEQTALNLVVHRQHTHAAFLPARFDWILGAALPLIDDNSGDLLEPQPPHEKIEILHLIHSGHGVEGKRKSLEVFTRSGRRINTSFDWDSIRALRDQQKT
ncbi:hypothetical protein CCP3SC1AL1_3160001 [Gammaproteobacteria bacterium]